MNDHRAAPFDLVVATEIYTAEWATRLPGARVILDEHNIESRFHGAWADNEVDPALQDLEHRLWPLPDLVTCVSDDDATHIRAHRQGSVRVVPNGTNVDAIPFALPSEREGNDILFVGTFLWQPNVVAANFLALEVLPLVHVEQPNARLVLCGQPSSGIADLRCADVKLTSTVESVIPWLSGAAVYANALMRGAGTSLKTLEALASGLPLVATKAGVRGFSLIPNEHYLEAADPTSFADAITNILSNRAMYDAMAIRGRTIAERFDWARNVAQFAAGVAEVLAT
jgi:glycosyltransferase involved in cell wall biosynthesis